MPNALGGTTYIISYELGLGGNASRINSIIQGYGTWAKITETSFAVVAMNEKATDVRSKLLPYIGTNGRLFVIKSGYESAWRNTHGSDTWLKKYLEN